MNMTDGYDILIIKTCNKCTETKPLDEFPIRPDSPDGHRNECKECKSKYLKAYHKNPPVKEILPYGMKRCNGCDSVKSVCEFGKKKTTKDGLKPHCLICTRKEDAAYREEHKDEILIRREKTNNRRIRVILILPQGMKWCSACKNVRLVN